MKQPRQYEEALEAFIRPRAGRRSCRRKAQQEEGARERERGAKGRAALQILIRDEDANANADADDIWPKKKEENPRCLIFQLSFGCDLKGIGGGAAGWGTLPTDFISAWQI